MTLYGSMFRADCHVHLGPLGGPHRERPPTPAELDRYARRERLEWIFGIYESDEALASFRRRVSARVFGFFWSRQPDREVVPDSADGLKLHPFLDGYRLEPAAVAVALESAVDRELPVLVHTDDRKPEVSRPALMAALADAHPETRFIAAHAGSYAPPDEPWVGRNRVSDERIGALVREAIEAARGRRNFWLETSILVRETKARLLAAEADPRRLLFGSDYPILRRSHGSVRRQEATLLDLGWTPERIERVHRNARQVMGEAERIASVDAHSTAARSPTSSDPSLCRPAEEA